MALTRELAEAHLQLSEYREGYLARIEAQQSLIADLERRIKMQANKGFDK